MKSLAHNQGREKRQWRSQIRDHDSCFLAVFTNPYTPVNLHCSCTASPTMASMWFGEAETTSICTDFFQNRAKHPDLPALGLIQQWSNFKSAHNFHSLASADHVSARNMAARSCARVTTSSSRIVRRFPSPCMFQQIQFIKLGRPEDQPPLLGTSFHLV